MNNLAASVKLNDSDVRTALETYIKSKHPTVKVDRLTLIIRMSEGRQRGPDTYSAEFKVELPSS